MAAKKSSINTTEPPPNPEPPDGPISFIITFPSRRLLEGIAWGEDGNRVSEHKFLKDYLSKELSYLAPVKPVKQEIIVWPYIPKS